VSGHGQRGGGRGVGRRPVRRVSGNVGLQPDHADGDVHAERGVGCGHPVFGDGVRGDGRVECDGPADLVVHHGGGGYHQADGHRSVAGGGCDECRDDAAVTATFSEAITGSAVRGVESGRCGGCRYVGLQPTTRTVTFTPSAALAAGTQYSVAVSGATDGSNCDGPGELVVHHRGVRLSVHHLARHSKSRRRRPTPIRSGRTRRQVPGLSGGSSPTSGSTRARPTPVPTSARCGPVPDQAGIGDVRGESASGCSKRPSRHQWASTAGTTYVASITRPRPDSVNRAVSSPPPMAR